MSSSMIMLQIQHLFGEADKDGDGKLTIEEWKLVLDKSGVSTSE